MATSLQITIILSMISLILGAISLFWYDPSLGTPVARVWSFIESNETTFTSRPERAMQKTGYVRDETRQGMVIALPQSRQFDLTDSFANYSKSAGCNESSLALHEPFHPLCSTRKDLLQAMASGGRRGIDAPYSPRDCDMRWFSSQEICQILSQFDTIHVLGDSMMRNLAAAMHVYLRRDLADGARLAWGDDPDGLDCHCHGIFNAHGCLFNSAYSSRAVIAHDPGSIKCGNSTPALIEFEPVLEYPFSDETSTSIKNKMPVVKPLKPHAFLYGHGIWNDLNETATQEWTKQLNALITSANPWLGGPDAFFPRLFITPSAAGLDKPDQFVVRQGNKALARFEKSIGAWLPGQGIEHLGMWNATVQGQSPDGTHAGMHSNLLKAMMVFNWLDRLDVPS